MGMSSYPNGFSGGVSIRGVPVLNSHSGDVYWVDSGAAYNGDGTFTRPFTTLDTAVNNCTADNGDIIFVKAGHSESLTADSAVDIDVAGVTVIGLGTGEDRPTFTFTTAVTADFKLAANNVTVQNLLFKAGIDALTGPIEVSADDCAVVNCEYRDDATSNYETTDVIVTASTPLRMLVDGFKYVHDGGVGGTQNQSIIQLNGADGAVIRNCWLVADSGTGVIEDATVSAQILIDNCVIENTETSPTVAILLQATTTGTIRNTNIRVASGTTYITSTNDMQLFEVFGTGTDATTGEKVGTQLAGDIEAKIDVIDAYHDVPTADATTNAQMRDVAGNKTDAAVTTVGTTKSLMGYLKGVLTWIGTITNTGGTATIGAALGDVANVSVATRLTTIDGFHDVPTADAATNAQVRDVVGNKTDAAVTAAAADKSLVGYVKGVLGWIGTITNTGGTATIGGVIGDVANDSIVARLDDIGSNVNSTTTDNIQGKIGTDTEMGDRSLFDLLVSGGPTTFPTAAAAANDVSLGAVVRYISEQQNGRLVSKTYADLTGYDTAAAFTVTGDVMVKVVGVVGATAITCTSGTTVLSIGTTQAAQAIIANTTIDNAQFDATDVWVDTTPTDDAEIMASDAWVIIGGSANIILTRNVDDITAGSLTLYCWWKPLSAGANVVAA